MGWRNRLLVWAPISILVLLSADYFFQIIPPVSIPVVIFTSNQIISLIIGIVGIGSSVLLVLKINEWRLRSDRWRSTRVVFDPLFYVKTFAINRVSKLFPGPMYDWPNVFMLLITALIVAIFIAMESSEIVILTAFYTSILFLNSLLKTDLPRLDIDLQGRSLAWIHDIDQPDPALANFIDRETNSDEDTEGEGTSTNEAVVSYSIKVTNVGEKAAKNIVVKYRVFNNRGVPIHSGWRTIDEFENEVKIICVNDDTKIKFLIDVTDEPNESEYTLYFVVSPFNQHRQLTHREVVHVEPTS